MARTEIPIGLNLLVVEDIADGKRLKVLKRDASGRTMQSTFLDLNDEAQDALGAALDAALDAVVEPEA